MKMLTKILGICLLAMIVSLCYYGTIYATGNNQAIQRAAGLSGVFNFPNPFNPKSSDTDQNKTTIVYVLTENCKVTIWIYNSIGDLVRKLEYVSGDTGGKTGTNRVTWNGRNGDGMIVANGVYITQIIAEPASGGSSVKETRKIAVVK